MTDSDDKGGAATGGTDPSKGGKSGQESSTVGKPKYIPAKPEHVKKSRGPGQGNKRG